MGDLAILGGEPVISKPVRRYNTIGGAENTLALLAMQGELSGFLGGQIKGGFYVSKLEEMWQAKFGIKHAIATNSATSGLLACASAIDLGSGDRFITTPFTMSATASAPAFFEAAPVFVDVDPYDFCLSYNAAVNGYRAGVKAIVVTNLFGHPAYLSDLRAMCDEYGITLIEDNAQGIGAKEADKYAGCIGHMGVFSLNVHKHLQCGEGGVVVTDDDELAHKVRLFINHGEMANGNIGLNLRMTEVTAAIACAQLNRMDDILAGRVAQARDINGIFETPWLRPAKVRATCKHTYYEVPFLYEEKKTGVPRHVFTRALRMEGVPMPFENGYVKPLYTLPAFAKFKPANGGCSMAETLNKKTLVCFENCQWHPTEEEMGSIAEAFNKVARNMDKLKGVKS